jgi:hypothetical protein
MFSFNEKLSLCIIVLLFGLFGYFIYAVCSLTFLLNSSFDMFNDKFDHIKKLCSPLTTNTLSKKYKIIKS